MPTYETIFITLPSLTDQEEDSLVGGMLQVLADGGGSLTANERMGRRRLAYPIRKQEDGVYTRFLYDSEPAVPKELERRFGLSDKVLRHLTVRLEEEWAKAAKEQAILDAKARAEAEVAARQREAEEKERAEREKAEREKAVSESPSADKVPGEAVLAASDEAGAAEEAEGPAGMEQEPEAAEGTSGEDKDEG